LWFVRRSGEANEFIETTLVSALTAGVGMLDIHDFKVRVGDGIGVTILGDAAFYSAPETPDSGSSTTSTTNQPTKLASSSRW
jgi:hypothetical protein